MTKQELAMLKRMKGPATIFEIYITGGPDEISGWEIQNVVILAPLGRARELIKSYPKFDCIITSGDWFHQEEAEIFYEATKDELQKFIVTEMPYEGAEVSVDHMYVAKDLDEVIRQVNERPIDPRFPETCYDVGDGDTSVFAVMDSNGDWSF
jgi:hypothetical protein